MPETYLLPAQRRDVFRSFVIPIPLSAATYVTAVEFLPGNAKVVHHANIKIGTVSLAATTTARKVTYLPITPFRTGAVKIVSTSTAPATVDGIAFLRVNP